MQTKLTAMVIAIASSLFVGSTIISWENKALVISPLTIEASVKKSFSLLEKSSYVFTNRSTLKCASCHHNTLTSMTAELARSKGIPVTDSFAAGRVKSMVHSLQLGCNPNYIREFLSANYVTPYILLGLNAEKYPADFYTDISVDYMLSQANPRGGFLAESGRTPLETGYMHLTALAIRAIQVYASPAKKKQVEELIAANKIWLAKSSCDQQQEIAFQLLAMEWCGSDIAQKKRVAGQLMGLQHPDGGWSQLPTLASDAYATGQSLYALLQSGTLEPSDPVYQHGLNYLLKTQDAEGAWVVASRSYPFQPFVSSEFPPYDENQFISASASNWATMALLLALPDKK
jgi:hypothetical protein